MTICPFCNAQVLELVRWTRTVVSRLHPGSFETEKVYGCPGCRQKARQAQQTATTTPRRNLGGAPCGWREAA